MEIAAVADLDDVAPAWLALADVLAEIDADLAPPRRDSWPRRRAQYERWLAEHPAATLLVAREGADVLGYAMLRATASWGWRVTPGPVGELETLTVLPGARGRGVGAALWAAAVEHFRAHGVQDVTVVAASRNAGALRFYERAGFVAFTSRWWISPVPDWPAEPDVVPVEDLEVIRPLHRALAERHALVEPAGLPQRRPIDEVWERHSGGMLTDGSLLRFRDLGFVHATVDEDGWATLDTGPEGHIELLAVSEAARGQGIGAKLLHAGAQATGANVVTLDVMAGNDDAERFYAREGFRRVAVCLYQRL